MIYFDHNATTPLLPEVSEVMTESLASAFANASSVHRLGRKSRALIDNAREQVANLVSAHPSQVIFTSGGTESNNLGIKGCIEGMRIAHFAYAATEHPSVRDVGKYLSRSIAVTELPVNATGRVDLDAIERYCNTTSSPALVSVMMANNETGVLQDLAQVTALAKRYGHLVHTDAVQAAGKTSIDFDSLAVNLMSLSAHKIYGPKGVGALIIDKALDIEPLFHGGGQEKGYRSGTENLPAIVGFGKAAEMAFGAHAQRMLEIERLRDYLEAELIKIPGIKIFAQNSTRLANTCFFGLQGMDGETLLMQLDINNIAVTSGSACSSKSGKPSYVLMAMGIEERLAQSAIRVSLGIGNTKQEVDCLIKVLAEQSRMISSLSAVS